MNDLPPQTHDELDKNICAAISSFNATFESHSGAILATVLAACGGAYASIWPVNKDFTNTETCDNLLRTRPDLQSLLHTAYAEQKYARIRNLPEFHQKPKQNISRQFIREERCASTKKLLHHAYTQPFRGENIIQFLDYLLKTEDSVKRGEVIYAKSVSIFQSSGTGKSRMLTEIGKQIFTLPICLRGPDDPGYPPSDPAVYEYFFKLQNKNDLSISAHASIARFLGAAHETMLKWLVMAQTTIPDPEALLTYWHTLMEGSVERTDRGRFFQEVVDRANSMSTAHTAHTELGYISRKSDLEPDRPGFDIHKYSDNYYDFFAKTATEKLAKFTSSLTPQRPIVVTYFDEASVLDESFWSMLRLLSKQDVMTSMWYVFMDTKSTISYFNPAPAKRNSYRLRKEMYLLPPYIAVGFDQIAIFEHRNGVPVTMGELQSIKHLTKYGRPMWNAQYEEGQDEEQIRLASDKLICQDYTKFDYGNPDQVFAVLSQRICVDTVLFGSEVLALAEQSVACHMKLLTGFALDRQTFYTHSPSEPILALAAAQLLYDREHAVLGHVLDTFSEKLCENGMVEKGLLGELAGRTLLTVARDLAAPKKPNGYSPNLLTPVLLMDFLDKLFGSKSWCGSHRHKFQTAFQETYVNFTHWIVTKDPLPEQTSLKLLANLWARGAALQCYFNQESLDLQIITYAGSIAPDAPFDIKKLSVAIFQIKNKGVTDTKALRSLRPIGLPRDLLMELGNETNFKKHAGRIKVTPSLKGSNGAFKKLRVAFEVALKALEEYEENTKGKKGKGKGKDPMKTKLLATVKTTRAAMDVCNRYTVNVRGASSMAYGSLKEANVVTQFATLIKLTMPSPTAQETLLQHMRPLERLDEESAHTAWMADYGKGEDEDSDDDGDGSDDDNEEEPMDHEAMSEGENEMDDN